MSNEKITWAIHIPDGERPDDWTLGRFYGPFDSSLAATKLARTVLNEHSWTVVRVSDELVPREKKEVYHIRIPTEQNVGGDIVFVSPEVYQRWVAIRDFAISLNLGAKLQEKIDYIATFARPDHPVELGYDFAPGSFTFSAPGIGLHGGFIFHRHSMEWSIHT